MVVLNIGTGLILHQKKNTMPDSIYNYNTIGQKDGYWEVYWQNDSLWYITNYVNGVRYGYYFFDWHGREDREYYAK